MATPISGVGYARASTTKQEFSVPDQKTWADQAARQHGVNLQAFFEDSVPGDEIRTRPGLQGLLGYCKRRWDQGSPIDTVVVWNLDRFSRADSFVTGAVMGQLMAYGVHRFLSVEGWTRLDDENERALFNLKQDLGRRAYAKSLSGNLTRRRLMQAQTGRWVSGAIPHGYRLGPDRHLVIHEEEAEAVRWMFQQYLTRPIGCLALAREMNAKGFTAPARSTGTWTFNTVINLMRNEHYTGVMTWNVASRGKYHRIGRSDRSGGKDVLTCTPKIGPSGKPLQSNNDPEDVFRHENAHPAIVDAGTFAAVQLKLKSQHRGGRRNTIVEGYPFAGLVYCTDCGGSMRSTTIRRERVSGPRACRKYMCSTYLKGGKGACFYNTVREADLLLAVSTALQERFSGPEKIEELRLRLRRQVGLQDVAGRKTVQAIEKRVKELDGRIETGSARLLTIAPDLQADAETQLRRWKANRQELQQNLDAARCQAAAAGHHEAAVEKALQSLQRMPELMTAAIAQGKCASLAEPLRGLISRIDLHFRHKPMGPAGKTLNFCTGGVIHFKPTLGIPTAWAWELRDAPSVSSSHADNVLTTGSTASEAARALKEAGAARVVVAVLARGHG